MTNKLEQILIYVFIIIQNKRILGNLTYKFNPSTSLTVCGAGTARFVSFTRITIDECILECGKRSKCKALNYRRLSNNYCELLETLDVTPGVPDCVYLTRSVIDFGTQLSNACGCPLTETCDIDTGTCSRTECSPIRTVTNGRIIGNKYKFGDTLAVVCDDGYNTTGGTSRITCLTTGNWDNTPTCQQLCDPPVNLLYGNYSSTNYSQGATLTVTCHQDYREINYVTTITCLNNAVWDASPECVLKECGPPPSFSYGTLGGNGRTIGKSRAISCSDGYRETNDVTHVVCQSTQYWDYTPECVLKECNDPPTLNNGAIATAYVYTVGTTLTVTCNYGYQEVNGLTEITCDVSANWDNTPSCVLTTCAPIANFANGTMSYSSYNVGGFAYIYCDNNYVESSGLTDIVCMATGTWDYIPNCVALECSTPYIEYGQYIGTDFTIGSTVAIQCNTGYETNNPEVTCVASQTWLPSAICNFTIGSMVAIQCNTGYETNNPEVTCVASQTWLSSTSCTPIVTCNSPWFEADGSCFYVSTASDPEKKFDYAKTYCATIGGTTLARLDTDAKYQAVKSVLNNDMSTTNNYWFGAKRAGSNHNMKWINNDDDVSASMQNNYAIGEPGTNNEHCVFLWKNDGWQWHNGMCNWSDRFVCEKN